MSTAIKISAGLVLILALSGCVTPPYGFLYTRKVVPYTREFRETPVGMKQCVVREHQIKEPFSGYSMYVEWSAGYLQSEAKKAGITTIHYVDKETLSLLFGIYKRESLIVYGD